MTAHILIVDPDPFTAKMLTFLLAEAGYRTTALADPRRALPVLADDPADLAILEATLPHMDGLALCADLHRAYPAVSLVLLSARASLADKVAGFNAGADDYLAKPFEPRELVARVQALLRRARRSERNVYGMTVRAGEASLDLAELRFAAPGREPVTLTTTEMKILECLMRNAGAVIGRETLVERVWGYDFEGTDNRINVYIRLLRQKIEAEPERPTLIETVRGLGYRFRAVQGMGGGLGWAAGD
jgi:two-component system response regulator RegX3